MNLVQRGLSVAIAAGLVTFGAPAYAMLDFNFSFFDETEDVTISGMVLGLDDDAISAATEVMITADGDLSFFLPQNTVGPGTVSINAFTVSGGQIIDAQFASIGFDLAGDQLTFSAGTGFIFDDLIGDSRSGPLVFTPKANGVVAEPGALALAFGGVMGLLALRRRSIA